MAPVEVTQAADRAGLHVHAVGIGPKVIGGKETDQWAVRVYVIQKVNPTDPQDAVPPDIDGVPTDVIESQPAYFATEEAAAGVMVALAGCSALRQTRFDPVTPGFSTGSNGSGPGTIACFCRSTDPNDPAGLSLVLSCRHVYAGSVGADLFQPAPGGTLLSPPLHFAELLRFVDTLPGQTASNTVDAAVGKLLPGVTFTPQICSIGAVAGTVTPAFGMPVVKHGQATGRNEGKIDDVSYTSLIGANPAFPLLGARFVNQIRIVGNAGRFADFGDSGSLVVDKTSNAAVGLLFAVPRPPDTYACANHINDVLSALRLTII